MDIKKLIKSYTSFTRTERVGLLCLCCLLLALMVTRACIAIWVSPATNNEKEQQLRAAWQTFKHQQPQTDDDNDNAENTTHPPTGLVNVNATDSATLARLGIKHKVAGQIVARVRNVGPFYSIAHVRALFAIPDSVVGHLTVGVGDEE